MNILQLDNGIEFKSFSLELVGIFDVLVINEQTKTPRSDSKPCWVFKLYSKT